ncbi:IMP dehydrogenase, partial [Candidatus Uhrbacteria bacterium]|nr:IMP dehydrogenase [Candidatus Uhrbacteria bacterium]
TFDDVLLIPQESDVRPSEVHLGTKMTKRLTLMAPLLSSAMDTVTETRMAIAMAELGGIGILHRNCTIKEQVAMVEEVKKKKLRLVGAAIGPHDIDRAKALDRACADVISIDCAHAHKPGIVADAKKIKKAIKADLIIGNIATAAAAKTLITVADALKVGVGPGSICTTRIIAGVGVPQLTAIMDVASVASKAHIPVIADGGIRYSGDIVKALAAGADTVMLGGLFAGTDETPGEIVTINGKKYKAYRGMGSLGAMQKGESTDRYFQKGAKKYVPEGVEGVVPSKGPLADVVFHLLGGLRSGMGYVGARTITELQSRAQFIQITPAGRAESHPHSITIAKQAPNYTI